MAEATNPDAKREEIDAAVMSDAVMSDEHNSNSDDENVDSNSDDEYFVGATPDSTTPGQKPSSSSKKPLSDKEIQRAQHTERKSGIVYMSRVPPFMKPIKVRQMLSKYGTIGRIYLIEEDDQRRKRRIKGGGNRKRQFTEGWIEFSNKKYAKATASLLNNSPMGAGGKKNGFYHDDLWNLKYLPRFKWRHLAEQLAGERAVREQRLETEVAQSRRELDAYVSNVERARKIGGIKARREAKILAGEKGVRQIEETPRNVWQRDVVVRDASSRGSNSETLASAASAEDDGGKRRKTTTTTTRQETKVSGILRKIF
ncbi:RNA-binding ATPase activator esf2 [Coemansia sp. RSA 2424]|nr:RNA-binding ATPase activator esf2 [Coemansia sp. RSA 2424]